MTTSERHASHFGASKCQRFGGEVAESERTVAVGDLVEAGLPGFAARGVELPAERGPTGDGGEGSGFPRVEDRVGLGIAALAGSALEPNDVASSVEHHVDVLGRRADAEAREVLAAALRESRDDGAAETPDGYATSSGCSIRRRGGCGDRA